MTLSYNLSIYSSVAHSIASCSKEYYDDSKSILYSVLALTTELHKDPDPEFKRGSVGKSMSVPHGAKYKGMSCTMHVLRPVGCICSIGVGSLHYGLHCRRSCLVGSNIIIP